MNPTLVNAFSSVGGALMGAGTAAFAFLRGHHIAGKVIEALPAVVDGALKDRMSSFEHALNNSVRPIEDVLAKQVELAQDLAVVQENCNRNARDINGWGKKLQELKELAQGMDERVAKLEQILMRVAGRTG